MKNKTIQKSHGIAMVNKNTKKKGKIFLQQENFIQKKVGIDQTLNKKQY